MTIESTRLFRIRGHVQGVGFCYMTQQEAQRLGLRGWVRNCSDYSVEAEATGINDLLDSFEQWLRHGPPSARVEQVESSTPAEVGAKERMSSSTGFNILR